MKQGSPHFSPQTDLFWHVESCCLTWFLDYKAQTQGTDRIATVNSPAFLSMFVSDRMHHGSDAASLVNRSANVASSALLIFLKRGTSIWWTFPLCCRENSNFTLSPFSPPPPHSLITPSLSPIAPSPSYSHYRYRRCCSRISSQYGCWTWRGMIPTGWQKVKMEGGKKGWGQR